MNGYQKSCVDYCTETRLFDGNFPSLVGMWRGISCLNGLQGQWYVVGKFIVFPTAVVMRGKKLWMVFFHYIDIYEII